MRVKARGPGDSGREKGGCTLLEGTYGSKFKKERVLLGDARAGGGQVVKGREGPVGHPGKVSWGTV